MEFKISVIVPVYNVENYIEECLVSILKQKTKEVELIVVNDGSSDNSLGVMQKLKEIYDFELIDQKNQGISVARNTGIQAAKGQYLAFVDSDDFWDKDAVKRLLDVIDEYQPDMIRYNAYPFIEKESGLKRASVNYDLGSKLQEDFLYENGDLIANYDSYLSSVCLYSIKKSVLLENQLSFERNIIHEDQLFSTQLFLAIKSMVYMDCVVYYRRYRGDSITTNRSDKQLKNSYTSYQVVIKRLENLLSSNHYSSDSESFISDRINELYGVSNSIPLKFSFRKQYISQVETISVIKKIKVESKNILKNMLPKSVISKITNR
ncbi:glycosyltransferase [Marinilactibacillus psychrotolerans]|uniref:glycosyltransferase n=1 Tax=Marinilactibacillus psychrotolerans TaxID=191770 RepID=UPI00148750F3|nr:glycosyltransferase [Marinilactibacillus psychrotolerans]